MFARIGLALVLLARRLELVLAFEMEHSWDIGYNPDWADGRIVEGNSCSSRAGSGTNSSGMSFRVEFDAAVVVELAMLKPMMKSKSWMCWCWFRSIAIRIARLCTNSFPFLI